MSSDRLTVWGVGGGVAGAEAARNERGSPRYKSWLFLLGLPCSSLAVQPLPFPYKTTIGNQVLMLRRLAQPRQAAVLVLRVGFEVVDHGDSPLFG